MKQLRVVVAAVLLLPLVLHATENEVRDWAGARWAAARVQDSIVRKPTLAPRATCGSSIACSVVGAIVLPDCRFDVLLNRVMAKATLRLLGTIYYFRGMLRSVKEKPHDPTVVDQATAIDHEYAYHITPAVNAVSLFLTDFESTPFPTVESCVTAGGELAKTVTTAFQQALAETQTDERNGTARLAERRPRRLPTAATSASLSPFERH